MCWLAILRFQALVAGRPPIVLTSELDYELPPELIASRPPATRDGGRLLVVAPSALTHETIARWPELVPEGALCVLNDTRVVKARVRGRRRGTGGAVELLLLAPMAGETHRWLAYGRANRPLRPGTEVQCGELEARVEARRVDGTLELALSCPGDVLDALERVGHVPIPPYLGRDDDADDVERYQTVFAHVPGSVAAPTAGLHLTEALLARLAARQVAIGYLTLHVSAGTFRPVTSEDLDLHPMHEESFEVPVELAAAVAAARARDRPVVAVGTTVVRALETAADPDRPGQVCAGAGATRLLIQPGHRFRVVDALLTNFHQPRSTLLALVGAFAGLERVREAYLVAITERYRFLSYGDAMWIPQRRDG